jgi:hypothetical protein
MVDPLPGNSVETTFGLVDLDGMLHLDRYLWKLTFGVISGGSYKGEGWGGVEREMNTASQRWRQHLMFKGNNGNKGGLPMQ